MKDQILTEEDIKQLELQIRAEKLKKELLALQFLNQTCVLTSANCIHPPGCTFCPWCGFGGGK